MAALVREAMDAGAAGFATSFAITHLGADGKPIPSRWADRAEFEALFRAVGRQRPRRRRDQRRQRRAPLRRDLRPAARARHPGHVHRAARPARPAATSRRWRCTARAWRRARRCGRRCRPRPLTFSMTHGRAVHAQHQPGVRRADGRHARGARARPTPTRRGASGCATRGRQAAGRAAAALGDVRDHGVDGQPELQSAAASLELADERGADPFDALLDLAVAEPDAAGPAGQGRRRQRRRGRRRAPCSRRTAARWGCPTPAPTSASCATPRWPPTCSATGCATRACSPSSRRSTS